eukprot:scaffold37720_cov67-Phaeocystis_antarctica.AAC.26
MQDSSTRTFAAGWRIRTIERLTHCSIRCNCLMRLVGRCVRSLTPDEEYRVAVGAPQLNHAQAGGLHACQDVPVPVAAPAHHLPVEAVPLPAGDEIPAAHAVLEQQDAAARLAAGQGSGSALHLLQRRLRPLERAQAERVEHRVVLLVLAGQRLRVTDRERHRGQAGRPALRTQRCDLAGADLEHICRRVNDKQLMHRVRVEGEVAARATGNFQNLALGVRSDLLPKLEDARGGLVPLDLTIVGGCQCVERAAALAGGRQRRLRLQALVRKHHAAHTCRDP